MAEGLIDQPPSEDGEKMEDFGDKYFCELLSRSFFQSSNSNRSRYVMHDLINDLANSIATDTCLHLDDKLKNDLQYLICESIRHSSITRHYEDTFNKFEKFRNQEHLRTFMVLPIDKSKNFPCYISSKVVLELIPRLRHLRVLSLSDYRISEIPDSFGELKYLRYLNLSNTCIKRLPNSIGNLYNLQTLKLAHCLLLTELPVSIGSLVNLRYLDVRGGNQLKEMPLQISKLKDLQILSNLVVGGSNNNLSIKELRDMPHLRGKLCISRLENVVNIQDARDGALILKHNLESLVIRWKPKLDDPRESESSDLGESRVDDLENERNQVNVLDSLQPHANLKKLRIESYGGPIFPFWIKDAKFSEMVKLSLVDCKKCTSLPCLGMLPSLKHLSIRGMDGVKKVGAEFYGSNSPSSSVCFISLESLIFWGMRNWEDWSPSTHSSFPRLHQLEIYNCPQLIKELPAYLPSLMKLSISYCPRFKSRILGLQSLNELEVDECNEAVLRSGTNLPSLKGLRISGISGLIKVQEGFVRGLQHLRISRCREITRLWEDGFGSENLQCPTIRDDHQLVSLGCNLQSLEVVNCDKLERLPNGWKTLTCLQKLLIKDCRKLASFPSFPPKLRNLSIQSCEGLKCLPDEMMIKRSNSVCAFSLEYLEINDCASLTCFPKGQLPTTLKKLIITNCEKLMYLPDEMMMMCSSDSIDTNNTSTGMGMCSLEHLEIRLCSSLTSFPNGRLPNALKELHIFACENLESLPQGIMHHHSINPPALQILQLERCSSLTSFPQGKFPSTLKKLTVADFPQLETISGEMFDSNDNSLESLFIAHNPNLKTLPDCLYNLTNLVLIICENLEFLPNQFQNLTRLTSLEILNCENIKIPLSQWGLAKLPTLETLSIRSIFPNTNSFSDDHHHLCLLPPTLTTLEISDFQNLESLDSLSLRTPTSLKRLTISDCPKLRSIFPREGVLPDTLTSVFTWNCPLLKARYSQEEGEDWPKIAHIPSVRIN